MSLKPATDYQVALGRSVHLSDMSQLSFCKIKMKTRPFSQKILIFKVISETSSETLSAIYQIFKGGNQ